MNPILQCEDAIVAELRAARRPDFPDVPLFNRVDTYAGERNEVMETLVRFTAPSAWVQLFSLKNVSKVTEVLLRHGRREIKLVPEDMHTAFWSIFICAASLRNPRELRRGAVGVVGIYEILDAICDYENKNPRLPGRLRNRKLLPHWDTFLEEGCELVAQSQTACVYEVLFRTRYQLLNSDGVAEGVTPAPPAPTTIDGGDFVSQPGGGLDGGDFTSQPPAGIPDGGIV